MKPIEVRNSYRSNGFEDLGELVIDFDESEVYEENETKLFKKGTKYTLISANGCSCWGGDWEGWTNLNKKELRTLGESWSKDWGKAEKAIGNWIKDNI